MSVLFKGSFNKKRATAAADTVITVLVEPAMNGARTRVTNIQYLSGNTAHTITVMKALARTTTSAASIANTNTVTLTSLSFRGDTLAANDYIVLENSDFTFTSHICSAVNTTTKVATISPNTTVAISSGARVWIMGATGEAEHGKMLSIANTIVQFESSLSGVACAGYRTTVSGTTYTRSGNDDPVILHSNNATAAGVFENISGYYGSP